MTLSSCEGSNFAYSHLSPSPWFHFSALSHLSARFSIISPRQAMHFFFFFNSTLPPSSTLLSSELVGGGERDTSGWPPGLTKPTTSHCLGTFYLFLYVGGLFFFWPCFVVPSFDAPQGQIWTEPSLNMGQINFSAPAICVGVKSHSAKSHKSTVRGVFQ